MEKSVIKILVLTDQTLLISQIEEVGADIGEPDCKLTEPFVVKEDGTLHPWLIEITNDNQFMMSSDKILTLVDPKPTLLEKYQELIK
jgi:hypothetical protein